MLESILRASRCLIKKNCQKFDNVFFYNFWPFDRDASESNWLYSFIRHHDLLPKNKRLNFVSVFGDKEIVFLTGRPRVFFTGENIHTKVLGVNFDRYNYNYFDKFDLSLGFDYSEEVGKEKYLRFPLWITNLIPYNSTYEDVASIIDRLNAPSLRNSLDRNKFAANISRHDNSGIRKQMIDLLNTIQTVDCAGKFMKNTDVLENEYDDNKLAYLRKFKFNICPENSDTPGYVTEKLFDAIQAGCIPVYNGSWNNPEPEILDSDAILFYDVNSEQALLDRILKLHKDPQAYESFASTPPFKTNAADHIWNMLQLLKNHLKKIIDNY